MEFESLLAIEKLRTALNTGTGRGVKVGIIDTGVASELPVFEGKVKANFEVDIASGKPEISEIPVGIDQEEHGTACAYLVHRYAPEAELFSIRAMENDWKTPTGMLVAGLEFAIEQNWDVINLSLGNSTFSEELARLVDLAFYKNQILIAARDNKRDHPGWPAACASVLAVDMEHFDDPLGMNFRDGDTVEIEANGIYVDCPKPDGNWETYTGSSFACPHVTAMAARLRESFPDLSPYQLKTALRALSKNV